MITAILFLCLIVYYGHLSMSDAIVEEPRYYDKMSYCLIAIWISFFAMIIEGFIRLF